MNPSEFPKLETFFIQNNRFTGSIPTRLSFMPLVKYITLRGNLFNGSIPSQLSNFVRMEHLDLSSNPLSGTIPSSLASLPLSKLQLADTQILGSIPAAILSKSTLLQLRLENSLLSGVISDITAPLTDCQLPSTLCKDYNTVMSVCTLNFCTASNCHVAGNTFIPALNEGIKPVWASDSLVTDTCCSGISEITCNIEKKITQLRLAGKNYKGTIDASISLLPKVTFL